jgi:hypothetical protein
MNIPTNQAENAPTEKDSKVSDLMLLAFLVLFLGNTFFQFVIQQLFDEWYFYPTKYLSDFFNLFSNLSFFLIPVSIKNIILKVAGLVVTLLFVCYYNFNILLSIWDSF